MLPAKRKSQRAKGGELPKRYRCRDKYNRALEKFVTTAMVNPTTRLENSGNDNANEAGSDR